MKERTSPRSLSLILLAELLALAFVWWILASQERAETVRGWFRLAVARLFG